MMHERGGSFIAGTLVFMANALPSVAAGMEGWLPVLIQSGALGLLAFVLWHVFAKFIPHIMASNERTTQEMGKIIDTQRREFIEALREHRKETSEAAKEFSGALKENTTATRELTRASK